MKPDSPTQQKIKQREECIIQSALKHIEAVGFGSLTLEQLAKDVRCSKGTVYNHFANKEDLLVALGTRCCLKQQQFYQRLDHYDGNSREKIMAIFLAYQIFSFLNPALFSSILNLQNIVMMARASEERLTLYRQEEMKLVMRLVNAIQAGVDAGDLEIEDQFGALKIAFTGWAMAFGNISLMMSSQGAFLTQQADREQQLLKSVQMLLDGGKWLPLSSDKDYEGSWAAVGEQFFAAELQELKRRDRV